MNESAQSDEELMISYKNGSERGFRILYNRHSGKVYGYLKKRLRSESVAADVFQEVFLRLHKSKSSFKDDYPFLPWLFTITHRLMLDRIRKDNKRNEVFDYDLTQIADDHAPLPEMKEYSQSLLSVLDERSLEVIEMRFFSDQSFEEISSKVGLTKENIRQIVSRAVRKLKIVWGGGSQ